MAVSSLNGWIEILNETEAEYGRQLAQKECSVERMYLTFHETQVQRDQAKHHIAETAKEMAEMKKQMANQEDRIQKLLVQLHRDYENSSKPSSMVPNHKKISNSREKTGKKSGGQPGYPRARQEKAGTNKSVPTNNNLSERKPHNFKRKQKQLISFRLDKNLSYVCDNTGTIDRIRSDPEKNLFAEATEIFNRRRKSTILLTLLSICCWLLHFKWASER